MLKSKSNDKKDYFREYVKVFLQENETVDNFLDIYQNYKDALVLRQNKIDTLYGEIKVIKKLKV